MIMNVLKKIKGNGWGLTGRKKEQLIWINSENGNEKLANRIMNKENKLDLHENSQIKLSLWPLTNSFT